MIYYLATPYSGDKLSKMRHRYVFALIVSEELRKKGYVVYSPIIHWHVQTQLFNLPPEASFWEVQNNAMIEVCGGIIIPSIPQWELSEGVVDELADFQTAGKEIIFYEPEAKYKAEKNRFRSSIVVSYQDIVDAVSKAVGIEKENTLSKKQTRRIADARHLARYIFMIMNSHITYPEAGRLMGTDHSTICHSLTFCDDRLNSVAKDKKFIAVKENALKILSEQKEL
ncbi:MAG: DUF1937 family protein [Candidatus Kapabacteria bacterium]|nr:DUF1937 family protein [Candidatus Kapabacteria bacterium]